MKGKEREKRGKRVRGGGIVDRRLVNGRDDHRLSKLNQTEFALTLCPDSAFDVAADVASGEISAAAVICVRLSKLSLSQFAQWVQRGIGRTMLLPALALATCRMACVKERVSDIYAPGRQAETKHQRTKLWQCSQAKVSGRKKQ